MAKQVSEFVCEFLDLPAQPPSRAQFVQNIDVAIRPRGPARPRAEDLELGDPVPVAYFGQTSLVNIDTRDDHHDLKISAGRLLDAAPPSCATLTAAEFADIGEDVRVLIEGRVSP
jgi:hypothetical protein